MSLDKIQLDIVVTLQGSQAIKNLTRDMDRVAGATNRVRERAQAMVPINLSQIRSWDDMTTALSEVERKYDAVFRAGAHMTMMGHGLIDTSRRIADAAMGIVNSYEGYDMMLRRGSVALNVNEEWQGKLDQAIQNTARSIGLLKPEEVAEGYYIWGAAAGMVVDTQEELDQITRVVEDTMVATAMAGGTLEGNLNGVFGVISQFNLGMDDAAMVTQTLALMTERTAAQFPDLINSLSYIGPLAESLGITFEDVTSILGLLADAGQKGSRAGRGLAMVIEGMSAPSGPAGEALDGLIQRTHGLSAAWEDVIFPKGEFVGMRDMLIEMAMAAEGMTDAERGRFYATAFTNNATRALIPLIEDQIDLNREAAASGREVTSVLDQQKYATDGAAHFFEVMKEEALGSITAIKGRLEASFFPVLQTLATTIMEMALPTIEWIGDLAVQFGEWLKANPELVEMAAKIAAVTAAAMAGAGILFTLGGSIMYLIGNLGVFVQGIGRILGPFGILIGGFVALGIAIWNNVGGIQDALKNFMDAVGDLVTAVIGDGDVLMQVWEDIWGVIKTVAEEAIKVAADILNDMADVIRDLSQNEAVVGFLQDLLDVFLKFRGAVSTLLLTAMGMWAFGRAASFVLSILKIVTGYNAAKGVIMGVAGAFRVLSGVFAAFKTGGVIAGLGSIVALLGGPVTVILGAIALLVGGLYLAWENNWFGIRDIVANVVTWFQTVVVPAISTVVTNLVGFFTWLWEQISVVWTNVTTAIGGAVDWIVTKFGEVVAFFAALPENIATFLGEVWNNITTWIADVIAGIGQFVSDLWTTVTDFLADLGENWSYYLGYILAFVVTWAAKMIVEIVIFLVELVAKFIEWLSKLPGAFADWLGQAWTNVSTWFGTLVTNVGTWMSQVISNIVTWISQAPGKFAEWLGEAWNTISTWFIELPGDIADWMRDVVGKVVEWIGSLPGKIGVKLGELFRSMKKWFTELPGKLWNLLLDVGKNIIGGIWQGIQDAAGKFWDDVWGFFSGIVDGVKDGLGIESPSKVFAEIGGYMMEGMAVGIRKDTSAQRALSDYANTLVGMADGTTLGFTSDFAGLADEAKSLSVTADGRRVIRVEMDLTSSDGSYDDATLEQLKAALTGTDLVRALERMAEAD